MSPHQRQLLLARDPASSSCLIGGLSVTFAEHSPSPGRGGKNYIKDWSLNILRDLWYVVDGTSPTEPHKLCQEKWGEVGWRLGGPRREADWGFGGCWIGIHSKASQTVSSALDAADRYATFAGEGLAFSEHLLCAGRVHAEPRQPSLCPRWHCCPTFWRGPGTLREAVTCPRS